MDKRLLLFALSILVALSFSACDKPDVPPKPTSDIPVVSQFVYDGLSMYYLWNEQMIPKEPKETDTDPKKYFQSVLYSQLDKWSWITDDVEELLNSLSGEAAAAYGFMPIAVTISEAGQVIGVVRYVYPNTPAAEAGLVRGDVIIGFMSDTQGVLLNRDNFRILFEATSPTTFVVRNQQLEVESQRVVTVVPGNFATNPVFYHSITEIENRRIGYLFYTGYFAHYNEDLFRVFSEFKAAGVTDLVLDLRYNPGGDVSAAVYLASMIAPRAEVVKNSVFATMKYNSYINNHFNVDGNYRLGVFREGLPNPLDANLDLSTVYILATEFSASASELTTFCLKPFMDVVHIGGKTAGKYTASWTVHAYDNFMQNGMARAQRVRNSSDYTAAEREELKNWAMQPIVARYTDRNGNDFSAAGGLIPLDANFFNPELEYLPFDWTPIGNPEDYLFARAIELITGTSAMRSRVASTLDIPVFGAEIRSLREDVLRRAVRLDDGIPLRN